MSQKAPLLEIESLKMYYQLKDKRYVRAVDDIDLSIHEGETLGLAGESGCGKSSIALTITGILPDNAKILGGKILLGGYDVLRLNEETLRRNVRWKIASIIPQSAMSALDPVIRIGDQIAEAIMLHETVSRKEANEKVRRLFELVGLDSSRTGNYSHEFSGGMRQRSMIAMALACNPKLVVADEPTTALDVIVQAEILKLIEDLRARLNLSLLLITHDLKTIAEICDNVAIMYAGKIVERGSTLNVYENPRHPYTRLLLASIPNLRGQRRKLLFIPGAPPDLLDPHPGCRFAPRCPCATQTCRQEEPEMITIKGSSVACHHAEEHL